MFRNLTALRSELTNLLKTNNNAVSTSRILDWLNQAQDDVATEMDPDNLIVTTSITTVSGTRRYTTDLEFNKIMSVVDTTNNVPLDPISETDVEDIDSELSQTGSPNFYTVYGLDWVREQPSSASVVTVVSSSASDTTQKVRINGIVSGSVDTELLTLNGTTNVNGTKSFSEIHSIAKDGTTTGRITVTTNSGGVTNAILAPSRYAEQRQALFLWPIPDGAYTMRVRGVRRTRPMLNNEDFPDLPEAYHDLVLIRAKIRGHEDLFRFSIAEALREREYMPMLQKLKKQMGNNRGRRSFVIGSMSMPDRWRFPSVLG